MPAAADVELDLGLVGRQLPLDDVARDLTVDARDLVAGREPGQRGGRTGRDGDDRGVLTWPSQAIGGASPASLRRDMGDLR